jgi:hypothetical protein
VIDVRELRAVLLRVPPLLADLIRRVVFSRLEQAGIRLSIIAEFPDIDDIGDRLSTLAPDIVIEREAAGGASPYGSLPSSARVVTLSEDLSHIRSYGEDATALTPDSLAAALLAKLGG